MEKEKENTTQVKQEEPLPVAVQSPYFFITPFGPDVVIAPAAEKPPKVKID
jgi:hypothetical protein